MTGEKFNQFVEKHPHPRVPFYKRPYLSRRAFFQLAGAGVTGAYLTDKLNAQVVQKQGVTTQNRAKNVIFILLQGAISHTDTFDLKMVNGVTPTNFAPATKNGVFFPAGLLPKIADQLPNLAIVRSVQSWALVHSLSQTWVQIGRNPAAALGSVAPNLGTVVALEKGDPSKIFPPFLALNAAAAVGPGYFSAAYAPFKVNPAPNGILDTTNPQGQARFGTLYNRLQQLDGPLRTNSPIGKPPEDYANFYDAAKGLMYNNVVTQAFSFSAADAIRYGGSGFGNACLVAKQALQADQGTRYVQIDFGNWDMHQDIYGQQNPKGNNLYTLGKQLDDGFGALISDLRGSSLWNNTMVVMMGEFGRTVGPVTAAGGRDHYPTLFCVFGGAGIHTGRTLCSTHSD